MVCIYYVHVLLELNEKAAELRTTLYQNAITKIAAIRFS